VPNAESDILLAESDPLQTREADLLRRFAATGKLKKGEIAEIQHIFGPGMVICARRAAGVEYLRSYQDYAETYDCGLSTIKWWIKKGLENPRGEKPPPLDQPRKMLLWWSETMSQRAPENVLAAARNDNLQEETSLVVTAGAAELPSSLGAAKPAAVVIDVPLTEGFHIHLRNLRRQLAEATVELDAAKRAKEEGRITLANRRYISIEAAAQQAEQRAPDILRKMGLLLDRDELAATLSPMLKGVGEGILALRRRLKIQLEAAGTEEEADSIWHLGVYGLFDELRRSGYVAPFSLA
jgi:hypothetical protein